MEWVPSIVKLPLPGFSPVPCAIALAALSFWGCGQPEAFHNGADSGSLDARPASGGGTFGSGGSGSGGMIATGGRGTGGSGSGGMTGTGGSGSGGRATGGSGTGGRGSGGSGTGGRGTGGTATGGSAAGGRGTGGSGTGGRARGGGSGAGGRATGGSGAGGRGTGGAATGGRGMGGTTGTGPCAGLCSNPITVPFMTNSGPLGTAATCHQVVGTIMGLVCGNFVDPRTFNVNGTEIDCGGFTLPPIRMGGYCMRASAGDHSYAYFTTF